MVGQRYRIWFARLTVAFLLTLLIGGTAGFMLIRSLTQSQNLAAEPNTSLGTASKGAKANSINEAQPKSPHPLDPVLNLAKSALEQHLKRDRSYTAIMTKRERISGKLAPQNKMEVKVRYQTEASTKSDPNQSVRPRLSVYLHFTEPKSLSGREAIWQQGVDDDLMTVHETGLLNVKRIRLAPTSTLAMIGNKYPMTEIGIAKLLEKLIEKGERDRLLGDCEVKVTESFEFANRKCKRIEVIHPTKSVTIDGREIEHEFYQAVIDMDLEHEVPIHYAAYMWPKEPGGEPLLEEEYAYENLVLNVELTDMEFSPDNPAYAFPSF